MAWYSEKNVTKVMEEKLKKKGFKLTRKAFSKHGVDIKACNSKQCRYWFIEVKGYPTSGSESAQRQNYFWQILGQILGRMVQKNGNYGICLPDYKGFYEKKIRDNNLKIARKWLGLNFFLVTKKGTVLKLSPSGINFKPF